MGDQNSLTVTTNKDGTVTVRDAEGKEVRYAKESDLLAVKGSQEAAEKRSKEAQAAIDSANTSLDTTRQQVLQAEAKISSLEDKVKEGAGSTEELAKVKQELEAAKRGGEELTNKALGYRRAIIVATYGIPASTVESKTMQELDNYEEAVKDVIATKGIGNYAIGGGGGGRDLSGIKPMELARMAYSEKK